MKVKLIIKTWVDASKNADLSMSEGYQERSEVWQGELDLPPNVYLLKASMIAEGMEHPICDVPFSHSEGYWRWFPPTNEPDEGFITAPLHTAVRESET